MPLVESEEAVSFPHIWQGMLSPVLRMSSIASLYGKGDVGLCGQMAREGSLTIMLPKRTNAMPRMVCNTVGNSDKDGFYICRIQKNQMSKTEGMGHTNAPTRRSLYPSLSLCSCLGSGLCLSSFYLVSSTISTPARVAPQLSQSNQICHTVLD